MKNYANNEEPKSHRKYFCPSETLSLKWETDICLLKITPVNHNCDRWRQGISGSLKTGNRGPWPWRRWWPTTGNSSLKKDNWVAVSRGGRRAFQQKEQHVKTFFFLFSQASLTAALGSFLWPVWIRWFALSWWDKHEKPKNNGFLFLKAAWLQKKISSSGLTTFSLFS